MWMSMTGCGRGDQHGGEVSVTAEVRSVNHRFLDIHVRCPAKFTSWEMRVRSLVRETLKRGKVDVFLGVRECGKGGTTVRVNHGLLSSFLAEAKRVREEYSLAMDLSFRDLIEIPDLFVFAPEGNDPAEEHWTLAEGAGRPAPGMLAREGRGGVGGKRFCFLVQEAFREKNPASSKAAHAGVSERVVPAKTELEKIRE